MGGYDYFTRKQAGILYGAVKRGELYMDPSDIRRMYNIVELAWGMASYDERHDRLRYESAIDHYMNGRLNIAQAVLDGRPVHEEQVQVGTEWVEPDILDWILVGGDPDLFDDTQLIEEPVYETRWVVGRRRRL